MMIEYLFYQAQICWHIPKKLFKWHLIFKSFRIYELLRKTQLIDVTSEHFNMILLQTEVSGMLLLSYFGA